MAHGNKQYRKAYLKAKRYKKIKMGISVLFNLQNCQKKLRGITNRYCYKANMHNLIYKDANFNNVKYQASIITNCNFKRAKFNGVDFVGCNLKNSNFAGATLSNVVFVNCIMSNTRFTGCSFYNVNFIMTNIKKCKDLPSNYVYLSSYPKIELDNDMSQALTRLSHIDEAYKYHVLHVNKTKPNMWIVQILLNHFGTSAGKALLAISKKDNLSNLFTLSAYTNLIEKFLDI